MSRNYKITPNDMTKTEQLLLLAAVIVLLLAIVVVVLLWQMRRRRQLMRRRDENIAEETKRIAEITNELKNKGIPIPDEHPLKQ